MITVAVCGARQYDVLLLGMRQSMTPGTFRNKILSVLGVPCIERLRLSPVRMAIGEDLLTPGKPIANLFFPETGMASLTASFSDGSQVEVGMFGYDSVVGAQGLIGATHGLHRVYVQIAGYGYACPIKAALQEFTMCGAFHDLVLRNVQQQLVQATQSAACNAKHALEPRLASWLMLCRDRTQKDSFLVSHEFLAYMLGSTRSTVSVTAAELKSEGLIDYSRGTMHLLDLPGLEQRTCECYSTVKAYLAEPASLGRRLSG